MIHHLNKEIIAFFYEFSQTSAPYLNEFSISHLLVWGKVLFYFIFL